MQWNVESTPQAALSSLDLVAESCNLYQSMQYVLRHVQRTQNCSYDCFCSGNRHFGMQAIVEVLAIG